MQSRLAIAVADESFRRGGKIVRDVWRNGCGVGAVRSRGVVGYTGGERRHGFAGLEKEQRRQLSSSRNRPLHTTSAKSAPLSAMASDEEEDSDAAMLAMMARRNVERIVQDESNLLFRMSGSAQEDEEDEEDEEDMKVSLSDQAVRDWEDELEHDESSGSEAPAATKWKMAEILERFDGVSLPAPEALKNMAELQLWLECESQRECVRKFESVLGDSCSRRDFAALTPVQRQMVRWYGDLRTLIEAEQRQYLHGGSGLRKDAKRYGPYLCTLQPEKLAVIAAHEATMAALKKGAYGTTITFMAVAIADAIEAEANVQRWLRKQFEAMRNSRKYDEEPDADDLVASIADSTEDFAQTAESLAKASTDHPNETEGPDKEEETTEKEWFHGNWMYGPSHLERFVEDCNRSDPSRKLKIRVSQANARARRLLNSDDAWPIADKVKIGVAMIKLLLEAATVDFDDGHGSEPAFQYEKRWTLKRGIRRRGGRRKVLVGHVVLNPRFHRVVVQDKLTSLSPFTSRHQPMVLRPRDWTAPREGGYCALRVDLMRTHGCNVQEEALFGTDLSTLYDGLNVLGRVPWTVNNTLLKVAQQCWDDGHVLGDIPSQEDHDLPPLPKRPEKKARTDEEDKSSEAYQEALQEFAKYRHAMTKYRRVRQKNMDLWSLRCSALLKLNQADKFKDVSAIFFPVNIDFRGRVYPVPPHFSIVGSDLCRGMLRFAESKPLGPRGLFWLKVHLANLAGVNKISFEDRAAFADANMDNIRDCVADPFGENRWWMSADDPFQALATCHEIVNAIDSGDPESFESSLPVHMDGSCNGLQHYAALGKDRVGGKAVNLVDADKPQDVYSGVMEEVIRRVEEEAASSVDYENRNPEELTKKELQAQKRVRAARLVNGLIDRGVVKRTVMTSVYGVTYIGATHQIKEKIQEKLKAKGVDVDEMDAEIHAACLYLASITMDVMGDLFQGARQTMNWLSACARLIASQGQPVAWMSPVGVPAVQPYRRQAAFTIVTLLQQVKLTQHDDHMPIHKQRQVTAFPPNYVHSLDSSHMLLTALEMDRRGLTFSAVHDSFWTHANNVDEMNEVLRDCFIDLYSRPLLRDLKASWEMRYPSLQFPELPETGDLDLSEIRTAPYFFQ